jgi:hypothetical protein
VSENEGEFYTDTWSETRLEELLLPSPQNTPPMAHGTAPLPGFYHRRKALQQPRRTAALYPNEIAAAKHRQENTAAARRERGNGILRKSPTGSRRHLDSPPRIYWILIPIVMPWIRGTTDLTQLRYELGKK